MNWVQVNDSRWDMPITFSGKYKGPVIANLNNLLQRRMLCVCVYTFSCADREFNEKETTVRICWWIMDDGWVGLNSLLLLCVKKMWISNSIFIVYKNKQFYRKDERSANKFIFNCIKKINLDFLLTYTYIMSSHNSEKSAHTPHRNLYTAVVTFVPLSACKYFFSPDHMWLITSYNPSWSPKSAVCADSRNGFHEMIRTLIIIFRGKKNLDEHRRLCHNKVLCRRDACAVIIIYFCA